jgi:hypothetical protein
VGLEINQGKSKYMIITRNKDKWQGVYEFRTGDIVMKGQRPSGVRDSVKWRKLYIRVEIRSRVSAGNKCYYALGSVMKSKPIPRQSKLGINHR